MTRGLAFLILGVIEENDSNSIDGRGIAPMSITVLRSEIEAAKKEYLEFLVGKAGGFTSKLFGLIPSADIFNRRKIATAFPAHVYVYMQQVGELDRISFDVQDDSSIDPKEFMSNLKQNIRESVIAEDGSPGSPGSPDNPVPVLQQCRECDFTWEYSESIKSCPKCGVEFV